MEKYKEYQEAFWLEVRNIRNPCEGRSQVCLFYNVLHHSLGSKIFANLETDYCPQTIDRSLSTMDSRSLFHLNSWLKQLQNQIRMTFTKVETLTCCCNSLCGSIFCFLISQTVAGKQLWGLNFIITACNIKPLCTNEVNWYSIVPSKAGVISSLL